MDKKCLIRTEHLDKYFRDPVDFQALKNVNIRIDEGEFLSIIGSSGSGKSTLLYVLSTLDTDYEGKIFFEENELGKMSSNQLSDLRNEKIGFVFQFHYLLPEFTVVDNVMLPALKLGRYDEEQIRHNAMQKLSLLGLEDQAHKKANKLSGGQQQRVAIARALINEPRIIFGDEPTGNLDSKNSQTVFEIFKELKEQYNQTIVVVTHDMNFANQTDRLIRLKDGEVEVD
ncbi:MAG: ABC transporter ATP-binding protein [Bacteroidia bacterium]|jgi:lipoprotein-releasing system ATP-binding protein|nr:ABC transporter ATP-binding protein [Bacteroidia bacterium]